MPDPVTPPPPVASVAPPASPAVTPPATPPVVPPVTPPAAPAAGDPPPVTPPVTPAAPAEVVYALTLPAESVLETSAVERATALAKETKLEPATAQKVLELAHAEVHTFAEKQKTDYAAKITGWETAVKADPEIGGANFNRTLMRAQTVLDRFGDPELKEALKTTGFGNYPALVRFINKLGASMESDGPQRPNTPGAGEKDIAQVLWPNGGNQTQTV